MPKTKVRYTLQLACVTDVIHTIRNERVILAADLAAIYGVETRTLNQAVKRNLKKFPPDFMFQLAEDEVRELERSRSQTVILKRGKNIKYLPYAFTEHGAIMAANVLSSDQAVTMSVHVVRAFVRLREVALVNANFAQKLQDLEKSLTARQDIHERAILKLIAQVRALLNPASSSSAAKKQIGFRR